MDESENYVRSNANANLDRTVAELALLQCTCNCSIFHQLEVHASDSEDDMVSCLLGY